MKLYPTWSPDGKKDRLLRRDPENQHAPAVGREGRRLRPTAPAASAAHGHDPAPILVAARRASRSSTASGRSAWSQRPVVPHWRNITDSTGSPLNGMEPVWSPNGKIYFLRERRGHHHASAPSIPMVAAWRRSPRTSILSARSLSHRTASAWPCRTATPTPWCCCRTSGRGEAARARARAPGPHTPRRVHGTTSTKETATPRGLPTAWRSSSRAAAPQRTGTGSML